MLMLELVTEAAKRYGSGPGWGAVIGDAGDQARHGMDAPDTVEDGMEWFADDDDPEVCGPVPRLVELRETRSLTPWFPVAVDPVHEGIYEVEYRQSRFLFRREWRDGLWCIPGAVMLPATRPKRWRGLTAPARTMPKDQG